MIAQSDGKRGLRFAFLSLHGLIGKRDRHSEKTYSASADIELALYEFVRLGRI